MAMVQQKSNPLLDLLISIIIPSIILMKFSGEQHLGTVWGLVVALSLPLFYGLYERITQHKFNIISIIGLISVLLTGGIGLLKLDPEWLAIKEAAVPLVIGLFVLISLKTPYPLIKTLIYNPNIIRVDIVDAVLENRGNTEAFQRLLTKATYYLSATFLFSAILNYFLARYIVISPAGTEAFNEELGQLTLISYPVIALPSMVFLVSIMFWLVRTVRTLTGLSLEQVMNIPEEQTK